MEAKDFMIGDYLKTSFGVAKIISIDKVGITLENKDGEFDIDFYDEDAWMQEIPLTPEILEKNGFESDNNMFGLCDYELSESYILENRGNRFSFVKRIPGHSGTFHIIDVKYVHQLQHILRLCRIKKEIII
jgi:hypothetical protein